ncbi:MAG: hypothetical protein WKF77_01430 [Planctomycetaceae bacterium]
MYRLLKLITPSQLCVVTPNGGQKASGKQLIGETGAHIGGTLLASFQQRLSRTRFSKAAGISKWAGSYFTSSLARAVQDFDPQIVVSVAHGYAWHTAFRYAKRHDLPFFLIVHDAFEYTVDLPRGIKDKAVSVFIQAFQLAAEVFCVSSFMTEFYGHRTARQAVTLLPSRDRDNPVYSSPKTIDPNGVIRIGYAGGLHNSGYRELTEKLAVMCAEMQLQLCIFGPDSPPFAIGKHVSYEGNLPSNLLIQTLREKVDVLFSPQSFDEADRIGMETNFPSKLADYTATGLPLLIWGPKYASSIKWARQHEGVAVVVDDNGESRFREALLEIQAAEVRNNVTKRSICVGEEQFSSERAFQLFRDAIARSNATLVTRNVDPTGS